MLQSLANFIESYNSLNIVSAEGKNFQILKLWQVDDSLNLVSRKTKLFTILKVVEGVVHLIDKWDLADQGNLFGFSCNLLSSCLPIFDCVSAGCFTHI